jgi:excisionase family DNA binding protein
MSSIAGFRHPDQLLLPWSPRYSISTARAAEILDVSIQTVTRMIEDGTLKAYKVRDKLNSPWRINYDSLMAHIESIHKSNGLDQRF